MGGEGQDSEMRCGGTQRGHHCLFLPQTRAGVPGTPGADERSLELLLFRNAWTDVSPEDFPLPAWGVSTVWGGRGGEGVGRASG